MLCRAILQDILLLRIETSDPIESYAELDSTVTIHTESKPIKTKV